jgi:hypothetical protein
MCNPGAISIIVNRVFCTVELDRGTKDVSHLEKSELHVLFTENRRGTTLDRRVGLLSVPGESITNA